MIWKAGINLGLLAPLALMCGRGSAAHATSHRVELSCPCVNLASLAAFLGADRLGARTRGIINAELQGRCVALRFDSDAARAEALRMREAIEAWFGDAIITPLDATPLRYGITFVTPEDDRAMLDPRAGASRRVVVLVHGLDDPGWMWRDVIPPLIDAGHVVARLDYPNDGPIAASADLLARELAALRAAGVERVDLVGKSMGGLVIRDALTRPEHCGGDGSGSDRLPAVDRFIMIGTPNHGSPMAKLRGMLEVGEHLSRAWIGNGHGSSGRWPDGEADGCGEAGLDLLPGSDFLRELNARPLATHTKHTIIAGRMLPVEQDQLAALANQWRDRAVSPAAPAWLRELAAEADVDRASGAIERAVAVVGDGLVTLESARLQGVDDLVIVHADHVGLICAILSPRQPPPAVPIVLERLAMPALSDGAADR